MNITRNELTDHLIAARTALTMQIREQYKLRNGFCAKFFRNSTRENLRALRVLSNIGPITAELYTFDKRTLEKVKKVLAQ